MTTELELTQESRSRHLRVVLSLLLLAAALAVMSWPADALGSRWGNRAETIAERYWTKKMPEVSCDSNLVEVWTVARGSIYGDAITTWAGCLYLGEEFEIAPDENVIRVSRRVVKLGWIYFCSVVIHEYGHLLGRDHSRNPNSIMYPRIKSKGLARKACGSR